MLLTPTQADILTGVSQVLEDVGDAPVPDSAGTERIDEVARADGSLRASLTAKREPATLSSSLLPEPNDFYLDAAATTEEDLAELAPAIPSGTGETVQALDPTLDDDLADWRDPDCQRPKIQVLGPVSVSGHGPNKGAVNSLASTIEFIVYRACRARRHPRPRCR